MINATLSRFATHENSAYPSLWRGCVGAWCPSLGSSGSRLHDYSRRMNWGTLTNMDPATDWVVSGGAYALDFDGADDVVTVPAASSGLVTLAARDFTVSWWMNIRSAGESNVGTPWDKQQGNGPQGWYYLIRSVGGNTLAAQAGVGPVSPSLSHTQFSGDNFHRLNIWDHIVIRWSRSAYAFSLFRNGAEFSFPVVSQGTTDPGSDSGITLTIGNNGDTSRTVDGLMDDMRIYNRGLSLAEIHLLARRRGIAFTPRTRRLAVTEQAAGGATPWLYARRRSQIIGAGGVH